MRNGKEDEVDGIVKDEGNGKRKVNEAKRHSLYDDHGFLRS